MLNQLLTVSCLENDVESAPDVFTDLIREWEVEQPLLNPYAVKF